MARRFVYMTLIKGVYTQISRQEANIFGGAAKVVWAGNRVSHSKVENLLPMLLTPLIEKDLGVSWTEVQSLFSP